MPLCKKILAWTLAHFDKKMATKQDFGNTDIENIDKLLKFNNINIKKDVAKVLPKCCRVAKVVKCGIITQN